MVFLGNLQGDSPAKDVSEEDMAQKEKEHQQQRGVEMSPVRHAELEPTPESTPEHRPAGEGEAASPGFDPKTPERAPAK